MFIFSCIYTQYKDPGLELVSQQKDYIFARSCWPSFFAFPVSIASKIQLAGSTTSLVLICSSFDARTMTTAKYTNSMFIVTEFRTQLDACIPMPLLECEPN